MTTLFWIIILILVLDFALDRYLGYLNTTLWSDELPQEVKGIYDAGKYKKQQNYSKINHHFGLISESFSLLLIILMFFFQGFAYVNQWSLDISKSPVWSALIFFGILSFASDILTMPFSIYDTFVIEKKFGFNKTTPKTFIMDQLKSWLLSIIIGGGLLALIIWIYLGTGKHFWYLVWIVISLFSVFMAVFYSSLIVPLFNKQTPLEEGELKNAIAAFAKKVNFKIDNIYVINGSKRSSKANAYFTGMGKKKRIVLYDTLIKDLEIPEIVGVLAHEIGHYKKKHIISGLITGILETGVMLFIFSLFVESPSLSAALGVAKPNFQIALVAFGILYSPLSTILGIWMNSVSRKHEYQADNFAATNYDGSALTSSLVKLSVNSLSNLRPHPAYVFVNYSHPTLLQRISAINKTTEDKKHKSL